MPYVPGFEQDIFISYASEDRSWVQEFQTKLIEALVDLGLQADFWIDQNNIRAGQNWKEEMDRAIEQTALFLAVLSPNYRLSDYCNDESDYFQELREVARDMKIGEHWYRYHKVVKMAWDDGKRGLLPDLQEIEFFIRDAQKRLDFPLAFSSGEFSDRIRKAAQGIAATLRAMRRLREKVYVASPADDMDATWKELRAELRHQGYVVGPEGKLSRGITTEFIKEEIKGSVLNIHLLGSEYHPLTERQIELCAEAGQRMAIWIKKGAEESAGDQQKALLKSIREFVNLPKDTLLIDGAAGRTPVTDLLEVLKPKVACAPARDAAAGPSIYLICDPSDDADRTFAFELERQIEQKEQMQVVLPPKDVPRAYERHQQMLRECDGVLLYREKAPDPWFFEYFRDVARAEKLLNRRPLTSKAVLVGADDAADLAVPAGVTMLSVRNPFTLDILEPFLAPLRGLEAVHARG